MMIKAMLLLGIGGILCLIGMWGKQSVKKGEEQKASCIRTNGVIDRVIFSDTGECNILCSLYGCCRGTPSGTDRSLHFGYKKPESG